MKLLMLRGLPASGKSTYANELVRQGGWTRINKDELRKMLHGGKWSHKNEDEIIMARNALIFAAMSQNKNIVIDDTNYHPGHEQTFREMCKVAHGNSTWQFEVLDFDTEVEECIRRDLHRGEKAVGEQVIRKMWRDYVEPVRERHVGKGAPAAIVDIDGTLAKMGKRGPFEWDKVGLDSVQTHVVKVVDLLRDAGYKILIFSGRDSICREQTTDWLSDNIIQREGLWMRPEGDTRKDVVIKQELYESLKDQYNIVYAIDDRPQVCRMWHTLGLTLLKVGDPDLEF